MRGHFLPQGHNLNKLDRGPLGDIKALGNAVSDDFLVEGHTRIICVKLFKKKLLFKSIDVPRPIIKAHLVTMQQAS